MEDINPWLDPDSGKHKNKKSLKPTKVVVLPVVLPVINVNINVKLEDKDKEFLNILVEDGFGINLPEKSEEWAIENFDKEWLDSFLLDVKNVREKILNNFPSEDKLLLLKYIFLLHKAF